MAEAAPLLELHDVHHAYVEAGRRREVLHGIDLRLAPGERVALLGRSGSGKSTVLAVASGIDRPSAGRVMVAGIELGALDETARTVLRRRQIGFVFQAFHLVPLLSVLDNVVLPLDLDGRGGRHAEARARTLLERVGLADRADDAPERLSGGEQQRVAIARALVHGPALVLADEPTGNLDERTGDDVLELFAELCRESGCALLMATHSERCARRCDRLLTLIDGRLVNSSDGAL
jgi:putative ABC transport system ATP-binding protein